ncbi:MAG: hypothetical protein Q7T61_18570 [Caulobacter sp.]|nr:hypothetical protein [Caulobacter sp.]
MPVITGSSTFDWLTGTAEADTINGLGGQDRLDGAGGDDVINAGDGIDVAVGGDGADTVNGDLGDDMLGGGAGADTVNGGEGSDTLTGSGGAFRFYVFNLTSPEPLRFHIFGMRDDDGAVDILNGGAGNDFITVNTGDQAFGGDGSDQAGLVLSALTSGLSINLNTTTVAALAGLIGATIDGFETYILYTTAFADTFTGAGADDVVFAGDGADTLTGAGGADVFAGGLGADILDGGEGADRLYHDGGLNDRNVLTQAADDGAIDQLSGGDGNDLIYIGAGDIADGGIGSDQLYASFYGSANGVTVDISGDAQAVLAAALGATLTSFEAFSLSGSRFGDTLTGDNASNNIMGDAGDDVLSGLDGTDVLRGEAGRDTLYGGIGADQLFGGAGADTLVGGAGNDTLNGDLSGDSTYGWTTGPDTAVYSGPRSSYTVNQSGIGWVVSGPEGTDTLIQIERIQFSDMTMYVGGGEIITGDSGDNLLASSGGGDDIQAGAGDDVIALGYGASVVDGGEGFDTADYSNSDGPIQVRLDDIDGQVSSYGGGAILIGIERIIGSYADDSFRGDDGDNIFLSGDGDDEIDGRGGVDTAEYQGARSDYEITRAGGVITIVDLRIDVDQTDTVVNVETFVFADGTYTADELFAPLTARPDRLQVTLCQASSLDAALLLGNDLTASDATVTAVRNAVGASVMLLDGRLVIVATAAEASFEYVVTGPEGEESVGLVTLTGVVATAGADNLTGDGAAAASDLVGLGGSDVLVGGAGRDRLVGGVGNDRLDGGAGADRLIGGSGGDLYRVDSLSDEVIELAGDGTDTVEANVEDYVLADNVEKLILLAGVETGAGNGLANTLIGNDGDNRLDGRGGADLMQGGAGDDTYIVDDAGDVVQETTGTDTVRTTLNVYTLGARVETLVFTGTGDFQGTGSVFANLIIGGAGNDRLDGGGGADTLRGGLGNDLYLVDNANDRVEEVGLDALDEVVASVSYSLTAGARIERLTAVAGTRAINLTGNNVDQTLTGNDGANVLDGGGGPDTLIGGAGDDTYLINDPDHAVTVLEAVGGGYDTARSSIDFYRLADNVEQLVLVGDAVSAYGNSQNNVLVGTSRGNQLNGGAGADTMIGGLGADSYQVDNIGDLIVETGGDLDFVMVELNAYTLGALVEDMAFWDGGGTFNGTGNGLNNTIQGGSLNDTLSGLGGDDRLDGHAGADTMNGGLGNDLYIVDNAGDVVIDAGVGIDTVQASIAAYALTANVENLFLYQSGATGSGNGLNNVLTGAAGAQTLNGLDGADRLFGLAGTDTLIGCAGADYLDGGEDTDADSLQGGTGDDTYLLRFLDTIVEAAGEGIDTVRTTYIALTLGANLENLVYIGDAGVDFTGNGLGNSITGADFHDQIHGAGGDDRLFGLGGVDDLYGDDGNDTLDGGEGGDLMAGGLGNDVYVIDDSGDQIVEAAGEGVDSVRVSLAAYTLADQVETLLFVGAGDFTGTGNAQANTLVGGAGVDTLDGGAGGDTLRGGAGNDALSGGDDNDKLYGETGDDQLSGGIGIDYLYGGAGSDTLNGGAGKDVFVYSALSDSAGSARDTIQQFEAVDVVNLSAIDADVALSGDQGFSFIGAAAFSGVAGQLRYVVDGEGGHLLADVNGDSSADLEILFTGGAPASLVAGNFIL